MTVAYQSALWSDDGAIAELAAVVPIRRNPRKGGGCGGGRGRGRGSPIGIGWGPGPPGDRAAPHGRVRRPPRLAPLSWSLSSHHLRFFGRFLALRSFLNIGHIRARGIICTSGNASVKGLKCTLGSLVWVRLNPQSDEKT